VAQGGLGKEKKREAALKKANDYIETLRITAETSGAEQCGKTEVTIAHLLIELIFSRNLELKQMEKRRS
jgi:hypothetical protein